MHGGARQVRGECVDENELTGTRPDDDPTPSGGVHLTVRPVQADVDLRRRVRGVGEVEPTTVAHLAAAADEPEARVRRHTVHRSDAALVAFTAERHLAGGQAGRQVIIRRRDVGRAIRLVDVDGDQTTRGRQRRNGGLLPQRQDASTAERVGRRRRHDRGHPRAGARVLGERLRADGGRAGDRNRRGRTGWGKPTGIRLGELRYAEHRDERANHDAERG